LFGRTSCTSRTEECLPVPRSIGRAGKSTTVAWTGALRLSQRLFERLARLAMESTSARRGHRLQALSCLDGRSIPSDGEPENPWGLSPRGVSVAHAASKHAGEQRVSWLLAIG